MSWKIRFEHFHDEAFHRSHRWKRSSESDLSKLSVRTSRTRGEHRRFVFLVQKTVPNLELTASQRDELARRTKLQRLRDREEEAALQAKSISPLDLISTVSFRTQSFLHSTHHDNQRVGSEESFSTPDLLKDHLDGEHARRTDQNVQVSIEDESADFRSILKYHHFLLLCFLSVSN